MVGNKKRGSKKEKAVIGRGGGLIGLTARDNGDGHTVTLSVDDSDRLGRTFDELYDALEKDLIERGDPESIIRENKLGLKLALAQVVDGTKNQHTDTGAAFILSSVNEKLEVARALAMVPLIAAAVMNLEQARLSVLDSIVAKADDDEVKYAAEVAQSIVENVGAMLSIVAVAMLSGGSIDVEKLLLDYMLDAVADGVDYEYLTSKAEKAFELIEQLR